MSQKIPITSWTKAQYMVLLQWDHLKINWLNLSLEFSFLVLKYKINKDSKSVIKGKSYFAGIFSTFKVTGTHHFVCHHNLQTQKIISKSLIVFWRFHFCMAHWTRSQNSPNSQLSIISCHNFPPFNQSFLNQILCNMCTTPILWAWLSQRNCSYLWITSNTETFEDSVKQLI